VSPEIILLIGKAIAALIAGIIFGYYRNKPYKAVLYSLASFILITVISIDVADKQTKKIEQQQIQQQPKSLE
jgi:hypothetical protein